MAAWQLAQINVGTALYDLDASGMADFMAALTPGTHRFYMTGINQRGRSACAQVVLTVT